MQDTEELVKAARANDSRAVVELVRRYEQAAIATAGAIVGDFHHAQDVAQESFVLAFRNLSQLRNERSFGPWLLAMVRRNAIRVQRRKRDENHGVLHQDLVQARESWESEFRDILPMLDRLPPQERLVIQLRYFAGLSVKEIARDTSRPIGTVTKQISRAIARLQTMIVEVQP